MYIQHKKYRYIYFFKIIVIILLINFAKAGDVQAIKTLQKSERKEDKQGNPRILERKFSIYKYPTRYVS